MARDKEKYTVRITKVLTVEERVIECESYYIDDRCKFLTKALNTFDCLKGDKNVGFIVDAAPYIEPTPTEAMTQAAQALAAREDAALSADMDVS